MSRDLDILDAIAKARIAFTECGLEPPAAIELATHEDGFRFLCQIRQQPHWTARLGSPDLGSVVEIGGKHWMEVQVFGMKVRWPAKVMDTPWGPAVF